MNKYEQIPSIQIRRIEFLKDTISIYNENNRAISSTGYCCYSVTNSSPGCAIGRHLPKELAAELDMYAVSPTDGSFIPASVMQAVFSGKIPNWMAEMGSNYLQAIQYLHDHTFHWNADGMTALGKAEVDSIIHKIENNEY